jgi:hypothetical protein
VQLYCYYFGSVSELATLLICAQPISIGRMPRCWYEARGAGTSVYLYHRMQETQFWTI